MKAAVFSVFALLIAGASYISWYGVGAADSDVSNSIRQGSAGNVIATRIK